MRTPRHHLAEHGEGGIHPGRVHVEMGDGAEQPGAPIDRGGGGIRAVRSPAKRTAPARAIAVSGLGSSGLSVLERSQEFDGVFFLTKVSPNFVAIGISYAQLIAHEPHGRRRLVMVGDELDGLYYGTESVPRP